MWKAGSSPARKPPEMTGGHRKAPARFTGATGAGSRYATAADSSRVTQYSDGNKADTARLRVARLRALGLSTSRAAMLAAMVWGASHG